jgi:hypothetical protein
MDLFEKLALLGKDIAKARHPKIDIGKLGKLSKLAQALRDLAEFAREGSGDDIHRYLNTLLPDARLGVRGEAIKRPPQLELQARRPGDFSPATWVR